MQYNPKRFVGLANGSVLKRFLFQSCSTRAKNLTVHKDDSIAICKCRICNA